MEAIRKRFRRKSKRAATEEKDKGDDSDASFASNDESSKGPSLVALKGQERQGPKSPKSPDIDAKYESRLGFVFRNPRLDLETLHGEGHEFRGFFTLFWMCMGIYFINLLWASFRVHGWYLMEWQFYELIFSDFGGVVLTDVGLISISYLAVPIQKSLYKGWISQRFAVFLRHILQTFILALAVYISIVRDWPWLQRVFLIPHSMVLCMKTHSYLAGNIEYQFGKRVDSGQHLASMIKPDSGASNLLSGYETPPNAIARDAMSEIDRLIVYPENVTFTNFTMYLLYPTFVYRLNYPRSPRIRVSYLFSKFFGGACILGILFQTYQKYVYPILVNIPQMSLGELMWSLLVPFMLGYMLLFFLIFDCICNFFAEITMFADRQFYEDWWNSTSFDEFSRKWNKPVHHFLLRYVYMESMKNFKMSKQNATLTTFLFSSIIHELVAAVACRRIRMYLFGLQMFQFPLIWLARIPFVQSRKLLGNIIFWIGMFAGPPLLAILYCREYFLYEYGGANMV